MKSAFADVVDWHIQHEYYEEMGETSDVVSEHSSKISPICFGEVLFIALISAGTLTCTITHMLTQVPLGVLLKSETKHEDMIDIVSALQHYAPKVSYTTDEQIMSTGEDTTVSTCTCTTCVTLTINIYSKHT